MIKLIDKNKCTGCAACFSACRFGALEMRLDRNGFLHPAIDSKKCKECKMCVSACPKMNENRVRFFTKRSCFCGRERNALVSGGSSSGGVAASVSNAFIENGGVVYGTAFVDGHCQVIRVDSENKVRLELLKGSKYVQSAVSNAIISVKNDLKASKRVLFIGTPCQVAGVKSFCGEQEHLFTIDLICGGVSSEKLLKEYVRNADDSCDVEGTNFIFREGREYVVKAVRGDTTVFYEKKGKSKFIVAFDNGCIINRACRTCSFAKKERVSDLTIGDYWGESEKSEFALSCMMPMTDKGYELLRSSSVEYAEGDYDLLLRHNPRLLSAVMTRTNEKKYKLFWLLKNTLGINFADFMLRKNMKKKGIKYPQ